MSDDQPVKAGDETFSVFAVPDAKRESTLRAINAINDLGGDIFTMTADAAAGGTISGTGCTFSTAEPGFGDHVCTDSDT